MRKKLPLNPFCLAFGHNYFIRKNLKNNKEEIRCKCCEKLFKYSINGNLIEDTIEQYTLFPKVYSLKA